LFENFDGKGDKKGGSGDKIGVFSRIRWILEQDEVKDF
jgi:hypothetical protein